MSRYFGVDLHRNCFTVCLQLETGRQYVSTWKLELLGKFASRLRPTDKVAVEVTGNTRLFYDRVAPQVARVVVVNPFQFEVIRKSVKKTDAHDARALAFFLSKDMLPEVRMKDQEHAEMASLVQTRDTLVKSRTALKNKVNNLLSARGVNLGREVLATEKGLQKVLGMCFGGTVDVELRVVLPENPSGHSWCN
jgi:transposase